MAEQAWDEARVQVLFEVLFDIELLRVRLVDFVEGGGDDDEEEEADEEAGALIRRSQRLLLSWAA